MNFNKYLPIGTVVLLKNAKKKVMITGFCSTTENNNEVFDYTGCLYPEGFLSSEQILLFNHDKIEKIYYMGLVDEEEKIFKDKLVSLLKEKNMV